ncbi:hypothetical protein BBFL7_00143 [Flavobacteria bacterium BBFL7]|nr:hypothetical protein BBFL7_00143 [Flavobacteria bacterium BBFL7]
MKSSCVTQENNISMISLGYQIIISTIYFHFSFFFFFKFVTQNHISCSKIKVIEINHVPSNGTKKTLKMKKISLILSMLFFTILITSCEQEIIAQDNNDFQKSGTFDAETTYWSILGSTESGMDQFDALTNEQKQAVWVFKYDRFIADNALTTDQLAVVNVAKDYVNTVDFSAEPNESNLDAIESQLAAEFDEDTKNFLFLTLENSPIDIGAAGNNNQTEDCFWCYDPIDEAIKGDCMPEYDSDGNHTGGFVRTTQSRRRRFWIGWRTVTIMEGCSYEDWDADGRQL